MTRSLRRRGTALALLAGLLAAVLAALGASPARAEAERLSGTFVGVAEAEGMKLELRRERGGLRGRFVDSNGVTAEFEAEMLGTAAEAMLVFPSRQVKVRIFPESIGVRMIAIPLGADGQPLLDETNALVFVPPGTKLPTPPPGYLPPVLAVRVVDPDSFLLSYEFWPAEAVAYGYESVEARYRPLFSLFPVVMTDILWKLCSSSYKPAVLGEALRGQGVTCEQVVAKIGEVQRRGRFDAFKAEVATEKKVLLDAARCARGYTRLPSVCEPVARKVAEAAVSLVTVAAVLRRL